MTEFEKGLFLKLFIRGGYVLDFDTNVDFDNFTRESVGVPLCEKFGLSKGKSLSAFCREATPTYVEKLLFDLLNYYEDFCKDNCSEDNYLSKYEKCKFIRDRYNTEVKIEVPAITCVNREYIVQTYRDALQAVENNKFDSAITKSRTILEEVFIYAIEVKGDIPSASGDIYKLYEQVKTLYKMHQNGDVDKRINMLLGGLEKILKAITEMRNKNSDAHGVGARRINISEHHTRLFVNTAITMAEFILSVVKKTLP